jgi:hypothetical protein
MTDPYLLCAQTIAAAATGASTPTLKQAVEALSVADPELDELAQCRRTVEAAIEAIGGTDVDKWSSLLGVIAFHFAPQLLETVDGAL